ncbi:hypothetical protein HMPREF1978_01098 [Actinomyces graevenitzii F0530]|uniref:Uncharacterized protein n=1 Tax=Actinomyces graevenitzii F0530 TaxID=1321817 RepID=U1Q2C0_9ACTO|nr:hypothetical protein HMPREF1978_01098 [Actinomyces graevenitzii F0530]
MFTNAIICSFAFSNCTDENAIACGTTVSLVNSQPGDLAI